MNMTTDIQIGDTDLFIAADFDLGEGPQDIEVYTSYDMKENITELLDTLYYKVSNCFPDRFEPIWELIWNKTYDNMLADYMSYDKGDFHAQQGFL